MFVRIEVLITELEGLQLLVVLRHILNPTDDGHGIRLITIVNELRACILRRIVRHKTTGNHRIHSLIATNLYLALAFLVLANHHLQLVAAIRHDDSGLAGLGVYVALLVVPELAVVDGAVLKEGYLPVALVVAPVGRKELLPTFLHGLDTFDLESALSVALDEIE